MERNIQTAVDAHILGSLCATLGFVHKTRENNPFTTSKRTTHKWMVMLKNVIIGGYHVDHIWLFGCKRINALHTAPIGTRVSLTGYVGIYEHNGKYKWTLKSPFRNVILS